MSSRSCGSKRNYFFSHGQNDSHKCTHCGWTNHRVKRCWELHGKPTRLAQVLYLHDTFIHLCLLRKILLLYLTKIVLLLPQKLSMTLHVWLMQAIPTTDITIFACLGISCMENSSLSFSNIDSIAFTHLNLCCLFTFQTSSTPSIVFAGGSSKCTTSIDTL